MQRTYVKNQGFTIVELLIVIVVIGILAVVSIVAYNNISNRAYDSAVASDAAAIAKRLDVYRAENGNYPLSADEFPVGLKISKSAYATNVNNALFCLNKTTDQYNFELISKSGKAWWVTSGQVQERASPSSSMSALCAPVGATWASDAANTAIHGYNMYTGVWYRWWEITK